MSRVKVVIREATDNTKIHDYNPTDVDLKLNGRKKPDDLKITLLMNQKCDKGDLISYVEDVVDLDYCTAIWNFQLSGLDDRGFNNDSVDIVETKFGMETTDTKFKGNYYFQSNASNSPITILNATQKRISLLGQFDIYMWIKAETQTVTDPVIFSRYDGTTGLEIGMKEVTGVWYPFVKVGNGTTTTTTTFTTQGITLNQSLLLRIYRDSLGIIRSDVNGITDATTYTETLTLQSGSADLKFGTDRSNANPFVGRLYQIRFYNGTTLFESESFELMRSKPQPFVMKFGGVVWKKEDNTTLKTIYAQSYANSLAEPILTDVTFTQPVLSGVNRSSNEYNGSQDSNATDITFKTDGTKLYVLGDTSDAVFQYTLTTAWNMSTASYDKVSFSVRNQCANPSGLFFKSDGTKLYVVDDFTQKVYQYTLNTAWDISTAFYDSKFFSVGAQDSDPSGIFFKSDGLEMYVSGDNNDRINQYTLSVAWDISSASFTGFISVGTEDSSVNGLFFKSDGLTMYIVGDTNNKVFQYTLSVAWDITTATYASKSLDFSSQDIIGKGVFLKSDGTKSYIMGSTNDKIYQYTLSTAYDISTATYDSVSLNIGGQQSMDIIKDIINNLDNTFIVKSGYNVGSYKIKGTFIADGKFFDLIQSLSFLMSSTFFTTPRKLLIFETNAGVSTNMVFDQDSTTNRYNISTNVKNDLSIINSLYLIGKSVVYAYDNVLSGDLEHGYRINVPQFDSSNDLSSLAVDIVSESNVSKNRYIVVSPALIHNIRINHIITLNNSSKGISNITDNIETIERYYPEGKTIINVGQYPLDYFDISKTDTRITNGVQTNTVTFPDVLPDAVIKTSTTTGTWKPADPTGTASTTGVMAGLGTTVAFVPAKTGIMFIVISGEGVNSAIGNGYKIDIRYGTGTAPTNGSGLSGITVGQPVSGINGTAKNPFIAQGTAVGLTVGTTYWLDVGQYAITGGTASLTNITVTIIEI